MADERRKYLFTNRARAVMWVALHDYRAHLLELPEPHDGPSWCECYDSVNEALAQLEYPS